MPKRAIVIGATGLVGRAVVDLLLRDPHYESVTIFTRQRIAQSSPKLLQRDFPKGAPRSADVQADDFFCCLGTTIKKAGSQAAFRDIDFGLSFSFAQAARVAGVNHMLLVSAMGADSHARIFYSRVKGALEAAIEDLHFPAFTIVRPSLLIGPRQESRLGEKYGDLLLKVLRPALRGPMRHLRSVEGRDVAACLVAMAQNPSPGKKIILSGDIPRRSSSGIA